MPTPEEIERQKQEAALAQKQLQQPGGQPGGSLSQGLAGVNNKVAPSGAAGGAMRTTEDFIAVNESLVNGSPREVLTGSPAKTGAITQTGANILTAGLAPKFAAKAGNFAQGIDQSTRDFFAKLDPTNTKIPQASTAGIDQAQDGLQGIAGRAGATAADLRKSPIRAQQIQVQDPGAATQTDRQAPISADSIRGTTQAVTSGGNAVAAQMTPAQIADIERMQAAGLSREDAEYRSRQTALADSLEAAARGEGPSLAGAQLQRGNEQAIASQMALAASARGGNPILAQRQAAMNIAALQQDNAAKSAELKLAEAIQARGQLGQVLDSARGQDISVAGTQAQLDQQASLQNASAQNAANTAQAGLTQDASKTNALNTTDVSKFNAGQVLTRDMFNSEQDFKAAQADQAAQLDADKATALNNISTDQFNAKAKDEMSRFKTDAKLRADTATQAAELQAQGMTLDAIAKMLGLEQDSLKAVLSSETAKFTAEQDRLVKQKAADSGMGGSILSTAGTIVAMCFPAGEKVLMADQTTKSIEDVQAGDALWGSVALETRSYVSQEALYRFGNATMTGSHAVWTGTDWAPVCEVGEKVGEALPREVFTLVTSSGVMVVGDALVGDDEHDADDLNKLERKVA